MTPDIADRVRQASGFIFDMDGTIALGDAASGGHRALPGAIELLAAIKARGIPLCVFTNGTAKPPAAYARSLRSAGFDLADGEMMTPSSSAAAWFVKRGIRRVRVLGNAGVAAPLREAGITCIGPAERASEVEAVYTGWFREFTFPDLEAACQSVWDGALVTTASHVPENLPDLLAPQRVPMQFLHGHPGGSEGVLIGRLFQLRAPGGLRREEHTAAGGPALRRRVLDTEDSVELDVQPGLLERLPPGALGDRLARLDPAGREVPALSVFLLLHERESIAVADDDEREVPGRDRVTHAGLVPSLPRRERSSQPVRPSVTARSAGLSHGDDTGPPCHR